MDNLKARFADYLTVELGRQPGTVKVYLWRLGYLERLADKPITEITAEDLRSLKRERTLASETVKSLITAARQFHSWGALEGLWPLGDLALVRTPPINDSHSSPPLTEEALEKLLNGCRYPNEYRLVYLGLYAGTRIAEAGAMNEQHWVRDEEVLRFRGKGTKLREVPVHPELARILPLIFSKPIHPSTMQGVKERLEERLKVRFVAHQLRKTFSTALQDAGVEEKVIEDLLGHKGSVTRRYAPVTPKMRAEAISRLGYGSRRVASESVVPPEPALGEQLPSGFDSEGRLEQSVIDRALEALAERVPSWRRWEVETHLSREKDCHSPARAIRGVGLRTGTFFVLDCDAGEWHLPSGLDSTGAMVNDEPLSSSCGVPLIEVSDETAAFLLVGKPLSCCFTCIPRGFRIPPDLEPPKRVSESWLMHLLTG